MAAAASSSWWANDIVSEIGPRSVTVTEEEARTQFDLRYVCHLPSLAHEIERLLNLLKSYHILEARLDRMQI